MQISLDPAQLELLRRQAEAMEKIALELAKLRKLGIEMLEFERGKVGEPSTKA